MSANMSSIRAVLIQTTITNIQKELGQLEHWLNNLPDSRIPEPDLSSIHSLDGLSNIHRMVDKLAEEVGNQRNTLNNILERIDKLEGFQRPYREVFIDDTNQHKTIVDPWLDNSSEPLKNEVIFEDDIELEQDSIIIADEFGVGLLTSSGVIPIGSKKMTGEEAAEEEVVEAEEEEEEVVEAEEEVVEAEEEVVEAEEEVVEAEEEEEEVVEAEDEEVVEADKEVVEAEEEVVEAEEEEEVVEAEEEVVEAEEEVVEAEEEVVEAEEEEEEEGMAVEEIEYNGSRYYKDTENFIYSVNKDDEPSDNPVGYWKVKTQTIAFYKV